MPMPGPINSQARRSRGVAAANRGYHVSGTDTTRPSRSATTSTSLVTLTSVAMGVSAAAEVLMPCLSNLRFVLTHQRLDPGQFGVREPVVVLNTNGANHSLAALRSRATWMWFGSPRSLEKKNAVRAALEDRRAHAPIVAAFRATRYVRSG